MTIPDNTFPSSMPNDLWEAKQAWMLCEDRADKERLFNTYTKIRQSYSVNDKLEFLKDEKGQFIKKTEVVE